MEHSDSLGAVLMGVETLLQGKVGGSFHGRVCYFFRSFAELFNAPERPSRSVLVAVLLC